MQTTHSISAYVIFYAQIMVDGYGLFAERADEDLLEVLIDVLAAMPIDTGVLRTKLLPAGGTSLWQYLQFTGIQSIWRH